MARRCLVVLLAALGASCAGHTVAHTDAASPPVPDAPAAIIDAPPIDAPPDTAPTEPPTADAFEVAAPDVEPDAVDSAPIAPLTWLQRAVAAEGQAITVAANGDLLVVGSIRDGATFGARGLNPVHLMTAGSSMDAFVARFQPTGELRWVKTISSPAQDEGWAVASLPGDGVLAGGDYGGTPQAPAVFGMGESGEVQLSNIGLFVSRHDGNGLLQGVTSSGERNFSSVTALAPAADGGFYAGGTFFKALVLAAGTAQEMTMTAMVGASSSQDAFVARFDASGALTWARQISGPDNDSVAALVSSPVGVIAAGSASSSALFKTNNGPPLATTPGGGADAFLASYDDGGNVQWLRQSSGTAGVSARALVRLASGDLALVASASGVAGGSPVVFGAGTPQETHLVGKYFDLIVARYGQDGTFSWAKMAPGATAPNGAAAADLEGGLVVAANVGGGFGAPPTAIFGPGEPNEVHIAGSDPMGVSLALAWFGQDGSLRKAALVADAQAGGWVDAFAATAASDGAPVLVGNFAGNVTFDPHGSMATTWTTEPSTLLEQSFLGDLFLAHFAPY